MSYLTVLGNVDDQGRLHTFPGVPTPPSPLRGGIAMLPTGRTCINNILETTFVNGFMVDTVGSLVVNVGGTIVGYHMGLPRDVEGRLVGQLDVVPAATDPYVNGVRVGPLGGVYATSALPT